MRRILAIDGGGLRGVVAAAFLTEMEERLGQPAGDFFDLIAGTSTGALIALGLGFGFPARDILRLYEEWGPRIFAPRGLLGHWPRGLTAPVYDLSALREALVAAWGVRRLSDSRRRLVIPSFDLTQGRAHIWRTAHLAARAAGDTTAAANQGAEYADANALDVALSAAAAPVYFAPHRSAAGATMVDGGVWAQNPVLLAVTEALWALGWDRADVHVLSLGSSLPPLRETEDRPVGGGLLQWLPHLSHLFLSAQQDAALVLTRQALGPDRVVRIDPEDPTGDSRVDDPADIPRFEALGRQAAAESFASLRPRFFAEPAAPFVPRTS